MIFLGIFKQRESFCNIYQEICKKITYTKEIKFKKSTFPIDFNVNFNMRFKNITIQKVNLYHLINPLNHTKISVIKLAIC